MNAKEIHDIKNLLKRLEIISDILHREDFSQFSKEELISDAGSALNELKDKFNNDQ